MAFAAPAKVADSAKGKVLVDSQGMTLYTFAKDNAGKSVCNGQCLANWVKDSKPGDITGDGGWL